MDSTPKMWIRGHDKLRPMGVAPCISLSLLSGGIYIYIFDSCLDQEGGDNMFLAGWFPKKMFVS